MRGGLRRDLGDFQTPPDLVDAVLRTLGSVGSRWPRVLEPTCGSGQFIAGLLAQATPPREIHAIEIQEMHCQAARALLDEAANRGVAVRITRADFFSVDLGSDLDWHDQGPLLIVGNPPWVTNSELGTLSSSIRPPRRNLKGLRGIDARTGSSNFDIAEAVWLKLAVELIDQQPTIAILCKTSVARNILQFAHRAGLPIASTSIRRIDAARWFGAAVDACLFCATFAKQTEPFPPLAKGGSGGVGRAPATAGPRSVALTIPIFSTLTQRTPDQIMGFARGRLIADHEAHSQWAFADGICPLHWRQGLKHDAASVMELAADPASGKWHNGFGEIVNVEPRHVYPLLKGTDLTRPGGAPAGRAVLVTQKHLGDDTDRLASQAPLLWRYLQTHASSFAKRKSSIYRGRPPFSLFGIGPYSFAPHKVAISGMHKNPRFTAIMPLLGKPIMLDNTCYFLPCSTPEEALILAALCNDPITLGLIGSISFRDAKRPITKRVLERIDFTAILKRTDRNSLVSRARTAQREWAAPLSTSRLEDAVAHLEQRFAGGES